MHHLPTGLRRATSAIVCGPPTGDIHPAYRFRSYAFVRSTDVPVQTVQYVDRLRKIGTRHSRHPTLTERGW